MSIVFFITAINFGLAIGLLWVATQIWQWRRSLFRLNRSLQVAYHSLEQRFDQRLSPLAAEPPTVLTDYQQLESQLGPKFRAVAGLQGLHRLWRVTMKKRRGF